MQVDDSGGRTVDKPVNKRSPTEFSNGKVMLGSTASRKRRRETFEAAKEIHGGTKRAATVGLMDTVLNRCSSATIVEMMATSNKSKNIALNLYKSDLNKYESSNENKCRSVQVYRHHDSPCNPSSLMSMKLLMKGITYVFCIFGEQCNAC
jgi:hypothetical protein